jgi:hypothetical protein
MTALTYYDGPEPDGSGDYFCTPCAMIYKGGFNSTETGQAFLKEAMLASGGERHADLDVRDNPSPLPLRAVAVAPCTLSGTPWGAAPVPVCWSHMMPMEVRAGSGRIQPSGPMPPGMDGSSIPRIGRG